MKTRKLFFYSLFFSLSIGASCYSQTSAGNTASKLIDELVGVWKLNKIYSAKKEVDKSSHPEGLDQIEFTREAKYIARSTSQKYDSGLFRTNEGNKQLYLQNTIQDSGNAPKEWNVDLKNNVLKLSKTEQPAVEYVYIRKPFVKKMGKD